MVKRRRKGSDEILLVPFLDILCSLIGVLILIIVVLCVSQSQQTQGRSPEEIKMAQEYKDMLKELDEREKLQKESAAKLAQLEEVKKSLEQKQQSFLRLRKLMDSSDEARKENEEISKKLQKELDDLLTEIDGLARQQKESKENIAKLLAELKKRQINEKDKLPPVVVQPSGSGMSDSTKVYFVECGEGSLKVLGAWDREKDYRLGSTASIVVADTTYNHFLKEVSKNKDSLVLFLIREKGQGAYNTGAGLAESQYNIRVGKLPIPGGGQLDLNLFEKYRGSVPPPPAASGSPGKTEPSAQAPAKKA